ncbi:MAG TPA: protein-glutamate O-methyltransferase CheR [Pseudomonadota bacterium]|nr:protein-glutamate O-methyltransferase CheR [Pseudomonadota bacterium]
MSELTSDELNFVRKLVREGSGMVLSEDKEYLIVSKMHSLARRQGIASLSELLRQLLRPTGHELRRAMIEEILIGETCFFRDEHPFSVLRSHILPELMRERALDRSLNLWCGAASTGQEPYSLAILLAEMLPLLSGWSVRILATDLSEEKLARARAGLYSEFEIARGMHEPLRSRFFSAEPGGWRIVPSLRRQVEFLQLNLVADWPAMPAMDLVLLRNVLIYFDGPTRAEVLRKLVASLRPNGYLLLGSSETLVDELAGLRLVRQGSTVCYRRES